MAEDRKTQVLFLGARDVCRGPMAAGFLRAQGGDAVVAASAGVNAGVACAAVVAAMEEVGIDIGEQRPQTISAIGTAGYDLVVTLSDEARAVCRAAARADEAGTGGKAALFRGVPAFLHWDLAAPPAADREVTRELRALRDAIRDHVAELLGEGYLAALVRQRRHTELLGDLVEDGVVAHDAARRIYLFNGGAERVTGRLRDEIVGCDCHEAFPPGGLCGAECRFRDGPARSAARQGYDVAFVAASGETKRLRVSAEPLEMGLSGPPGVLAVFRDVTEVSDLRWKLQRRESYHGMVGQSSALRDVFGTIRSVSGSDYPILVTGESGTGKELVARAIHEESARREGPFVPVNCGALPDNLLESELFGHSRGAFTGAVRQKRGRFELADGGTIFLDEVGELPPSFQVKLLRVLQEQRFERVGGEKPISVNVRVVSATNRDLRAMMQSGSFREDLFYRLCVIPVHLPPLRERREDIPLLVDHVLARIREESGRKLAGIADEAMDALSDHSWPGNVRELINALQFASVRAPGDTIEAADLPPEIRRGAAFVPAGGSYPLGAAPVRSRRTKLDRASVRQALAASGGNKVQAAKLLGVGRATLYRFLDREPL